MAFFQNQSEDLIQVIATIDAFAEYWELEEDITFDHDRISSVIRGMWADFPANGGLSAASVFKKAANFFCYFVGERPIITTFPEEIFGEIVKIHNHQNVMIGFQIVANMLDGATINRAGQEPIVLQTPLRMSKHSYCDLIDACHSITSQAHFMMVALLLEQITYRNNPDASDELIML